jgi:hypothetical protein
MRTTCRTPVLMAAILCLATVILPSLADAEEPCTFENLFFLHHSTGRYLIEDGDMRACFMTYNSMHGTEFGLWDHDYNYIGLTNPQGEQLGYSYGWNDTDPVDLHALFTTPNAARDSILINHEVIAFKSCFPASDITSDAELAQRKQYYLEMRDFFDTRPDRIFIVMTQPPLHHNATTVEHADRARAFANWLASGAFLNGHENIRTFDLFDHLAHPDDGSEVRNTLRYEYEKDHSGTDSHPNLQANQVVGPQLADFFTQTVESVPVRRKSLGELKALYAPAKVRR